MWSIGLGNINYLIMGVLQGGGCRTKKSGLFDFAFRVKNSISFLSLKLGIFQGKKCETKNILDQSLNSLFSC